MAMEKSSAAVANPATKEQKAVSPPRHLPLYKVILHNDDKLTFEDVIESIVMLTPLQTLEAQQRAEEAHSHGCSLLLIIHRERAELYQEQFQSRQVTVTIEPAE